MADDRSADGSDAPLSAEEVASRTFSTAFRGFDPVEVRAFLGRVADELRALADRGPRGEVGVDEAAVAELEELRGEVARVRAQLEQERAALSDSAARLADAEDRARMLRRDATEQVSSVAAAARAEAEKLVASAREDAGRVMATAKEEAARVTALAREERERATEVLNRAVAEGKQAGEAAAAELRKDAERDAALTRVKAREEADRIIEAAKERGREMVGEAQAVRERMLKDLARRRRTAEAQLENLRVSRDRVLEGLRGARRAIDEITTRFDTIDGPGRAGAEPPRPSAAGPSAPTTIAGPEAPRPSTPPSQGPAQSPTGTSPTAAARPTEVVREAGVGPARLARAPEPPAVAASSGTASDGANADVAPAEEPPPEQREERRSAALRILRRSRPQPPPPRPREENVEGVRLIGPPPRVSAPAEPAQVAAETAPDVEAATGSGEDGGAENGAPIDVDESDIETEAHRERVEDRTPEEQPREEPSTEDDSTEAEDVAEDLAFAVGDVEEIEDIDDDSDDGGVLESEHLPEEETEAPPGDVSLEAPTSTAPPAPAAQVDELFAKIRASREAAVNRARDVLAQSDAPIAAAEPEPEERPVSNADEARLQARDNAVESIASALGRRLKRAIQDEQNATLDALRTARRAPSLEILPPEDDHVAYFRWLVEPFLVDAASQGCGQRGLEVDVGELAEALASDVVAPLRDRLGRVFASGASGEVDEAELRDAVNAVYREWKTQRPERLAPHYVIAAHARGAFAAASEGAVLRWVVDDDAPCPDCDDNALAGPVPKGETYPTGQLHPPAHPGCRCILVEAS